MHHAGGPEPGPRRGRRRRSGRHGSARAARRRPRTPRRRRRHPGRRPGRGDRPAGGRRARRPTVPHTRDPAVRADRAGAPLWQLVDFVDGVPDAERAGLEAALEASGILDAWLDPDGALRDVTGDVLLSPSDAARPDTALATVLQPAIDPDDARAAAVPEAAVAGALASIGLGESPGTWVDADGRFRIGVLTGAWTSRPRSTSGAALARPRGGRGSPRCGAKPAGCRRAGRDRRGRAPARGAPRVPGRPRSTACPPTPTCARHMPPSRRWRGSTPSWPGNAPRRNPCSPTPPRAPRPRPRP